MNNKISPKLILLLSIIFIFISISLSYSELQGLLPNQMDGMINGIGLLFIYALFYGNVAVFSMLYFIVLWLGFYFIYKIYFIIISSKNKQ